MLAFQIVGQHNKDIDNDNYVYLQSSFAYQQIFHLVAKNGILNTNSNTNADTNLKQLFVE